MCLHMDINTSSMGIISQSYPDAHRMHLGVGNAVGNWELSKRFIWDSKTLWLHRHQDIWWRSNPHKENMEIIGSRTKSNARNKEEGRGSNWQGIGDKDFTGKIGGIYWVPSFYGCGGSSSSSGLPRPVWFLPVLFFSSVNQSSNLILHPKSIS